MSEEKLVLTWKEFWHDLIGLPESSARVMMRTVDAPPFFCLGRRRYIRVEDANAWLERMVVDRRYVQRKNTRRAAA